MVHRPDEVHVFLLRSILRVSLCSGKHDQCETVKQWEVYISRVSKGFLSWWLTKLRAPPGCGLACVWCNLQLLTCKTCCYYISHVTHIGHLMWFKPWSFKTFPLVRQRRRYGAPKGTKDFSRARETSLCSRDALNWELTIRVNESWFTMGVRHTRLSFTLLCFWARIVSLFPPSEKVREIKPTSKRKGNSVKKTTGILQTFKVIKLICYCKPILGRSHIYSFLNRSIFTSSAIQKPDTNSVAMTMSALIGWLISFPVSRKRWP